MRKLEEYGNLRVLSSEVFSVLQRWAVDEPLLPNLKTLQLWKIAEDFIPFVPLFLSLRTTTIVITIDTHDLPKAMVASMVATFPRLCPTLQNVDLRSLPRDPMITAAISEMLLASNRNTFRSFRVNSPLTEEAREAIFKLSDLRELSMVIEKDTPLPLVVLPNLTDLVIKYDYDHDWLQGFRRATLGKLASVTFFAESESIGDFLKAFENVALTTSTQTTLSTFKFRASRLWSPNYHSLLPFTQLTTLIVSFPCDGGCSSRVDDETIMNLARTMPKLAILQLGSSPCHEIPIGVTIRGFMFLANHCPDLSELCVHFKVASLSAPPAIARMPFGVDSTSARRDCALTELEVGAIQVPGESVWVVALTLVRVFPHLESIDCIDESWREVMSAIYLSRQIVDQLGKEHPSSKPRSDFNDTSPKATLEDSS